MSELENIQMLLRQKEWQQAMRKADDLLDGETATEVLPLMIRAAMALRDETAIVKYLDLLLELQPAAMDALELRVRMHLHRGRPDLAAALYARAAEHQAVAGDSWFNAAYYMKQAGQYEQALHWYRAALDANVQGPQQVYLNMAVIYSDYLANDLDARACLKQALLLAPDYSDAWYNLGNLAEQQGDASEARAAFLNAYRTNPGHFAALARLADLKTFDDPNDADLAAIRQGIENPKASATDKCHLYYGLGKGLNDCHAYDAAWQAYSAANRLNKHSQPAYQRDAQRNLVDSIIACYPTSGASLGGETSAPELIFICGMFRSGSTLTEQILGVLPNICNGGEIEHLHRVLSLQRGYFPEQASRLSKPSLEEIRDGYLHEVRQAFPEALYLTDKRPENYLYVGLIKQLFPKAKFIWTERNPFDNALSAYFQYLGQSMNYATNLDDTLHYRDQMQRLKQHWLGLYPDSIFTLDYDRVVAEPESELRRLLTFLELEWDEGVLNFHTRRNSVKTASVWQVRKPLYGTSSGRTRHYIDAINASGEFPEFSRRFSVAD